MQQMNIHKNKLIALAEAAMALIGMFLAWTIEKYPAQFLNQQAGQGMTSSTMNGFNSWGWLALIGIILVVVATFFINHHSIDYTGNAKMLAIAGFAVIAAGALIYFISLNSASKQAMQIAQQRGIAYSASSGIGLWSTFLAGLIGISWLTGLLQKITLPKQQSGYPTQHYAPHQAHYPPPPNYAQGQYPPPPQYNQPNNVPPQYAAGNQPPQQYGQDQPGYQYPPQHSQSTQQPQSYPPPHPSNPSQEQPPPANPYI